MKFTRQAVGGAMLAVISVSPVFAQQDIPWKQVLSTPKGAGMPAGVKADILGIETGDTYEEVKAKLEKLLAEGIQPKESPKPVQPSVKSHGPGFFTITPGNMMDERVQPEKLKEGRVRFNLRGPGTSVVAANFVNTLKIERRLPGKTSRFINETITVVLSAPSSGHQVIGINRYVNYNDDSDQPRISELLNALSAKFKVEMRDWGSGDYDFQFNDGKPYVQPGNTLSKCGVSYIARDEQEVGFINKSGTCDIFLRVHVTRGMSPDHARTISFTLADNDRAKANLTTDYGYFRSFVKGLQENTKGAQPKL